MTNGGVITASLIGGSLIPHFTSCHPPGVNRGFVKGEAIRLLRTNSSKTTFEECLSNFKLGLEARGYPKAMIERSLTGVTFASRQSALKQKIKIGPHCVHVSVWAYCIRVSSI